MGLELGGDYITKPISPLIFKIRMRNHVDLKRKSDILQNLSIKDGLTGIYNRRYFDQFIEKEWRRAQRKGVDPISLIMMDIARYGGEEIVCLMPGCTLNDVEQIALKIQNTLSTLALPHAFSDAQHQSRSA